jgi:hypothetical protein
MIKRLRHSLCVFAIAGLAYSAHSLVTGAPAKAIQPVCDCSGSLDCHGSGATICVLCENGGGKGYCATVL